MNDTDKLRDELEQQKLYAGIYKNVIETTTKEYEKLAEIITGCPRCRCLLTLVKELKGEN